MNKNKVSEITRSHNGCGKTPRRFPGIVSRRSFIAAGASAGISLAAAKSGLGETMKSDTDEIKFGVIADLHYAEKEMKINRYYRESGAKLKKCIKTISPLNPTFLIELGDFVDRAERETELGYLAAIDKIFGEYNGDRYYVLGNHDVATFSKQEFIRYCGAHSNYYSFDHGDFHFVVLDANYNKDGSDYNAGNFDWKEPYIRSTQQKWLKDNLAKAQRKSTIVFVHQNLHDETDPHGVKNAPEVRSILENAGNILAVFQGHDHRGGYACINGIHYVTLRAAVEGSGLENNAFAVVFVNKDGNIRVEGYGKQESYRW